MTLCPWCGQQTQADNVCDWCKRPIDRKAVPAGARNDLDFLKEDGEGGHSSLLRWGAVGACAIACGVALFFVLRGSTNDMPESVSANSRDGGPPRPPAQTSPQATAKLVSMPQMASRRPEFWIQQWNNGNDIISNAASWSNRAPTARGSADIKTNVPLNSPVKLEKVAMTLVTLQNGDKRAVGKADIVNGTQNNIIDFRLELVWADKDFALMPLEGTKKSLHQVYYKSLRPGKRMTVQLVSTKIKNRPDGSPNLLRLTSWLDGGPGTTIDEYPIQFGR
jgi:hypothetical protein